jgi:hypothetical protein
VAGRSRKLPSTLWSDLVRSQCRNHPTRLSPLRLIAALALSTVPSVAALQTTTAGKLVTAPKYLSISVSQSRAFSKNPECATYNQARVCVTASTLGITATWTNDLNEVEYIYVFQASSGAASGINIRRAVNMNHGSGTLTIDAGSGPGEMPAGDVITDATLSLPNGKQVGGVYNFYGVIGAQGGQPADCTEDKPQNVVGAVVSIIAVNTIGCSGYYIVTSNGGVFGRGTAPVYGSVQGKATIASAAVAPVFGGYLLLGSNGRVYPFGAAEYEGSVAESRETSPVVGIASTRDGHGYWIATQDGGVHPFGDAKFKGSLAGRKLA